MATTRKELDSTIADYTRSVQAKRTADIVKFIKELWSEHPHLHDIRDDVATEVAAKFGDQG